MVGRAARWARLAAMGAVGWYVRRLRAERAEQQQRLRKSLSQLEAGDARADRTRRLLQITDAALAALPLDDLLVELLRRVCDGIPAEAGALLLTDSALGETPVLRAAYGFEPQGDAGTWLPGRGLAARVTGERRAVALVRADVEEVRLTALREMGAVAGAPLLVGSRVIGVLEVGRREAVSFAEEELALLQLAADRTALAIDHARVFERERHIATTLQRSLIPAWLPEIPGAILETRFLPAGAGQEVGGDFYDVVALGRDRWLLVIGDVCGKGADAAALTAMVRYTVRAEASHERSPAELLRLLNLAMIRQRADRRRATDFSFCTLVCLLVDCGTEDRVLTMAGGGHPMPLILRADGDIEPPPEPGGPLVGVWPDAEFSERTCHLDAGDVVVAYTDGLLEAHAPERILDPDDLARLASDCRRHPLGVFLRALEGAALGSSIEPVRDDIAILAMAVQPTPLGGEAGTGFPGNEASWPDDSPATSDEFTADGDPEGAEGTEPTGVFALGL